MVDRLYKKKMTSFLGETTEIEIKNVNVNFDIYRSRRNITLSEKKL